MKFYGRGREIELLRKVRTDSHSFARFTVVTGRRRIGKTELIRQAYDDGADPYLHLVITKKTEKVLCERLQRDVVKGLGIVIHGTCGHFSELFEELMKESLARPFTLVFDEFQEFDRVDSSIFGEIAGIWDRYHNRSKINLVVCGSVNRLMNKIFFDDSEPLYGRNTGKLHLDPFTPTVLKEILQDFNGKYKPDDLLSLWTITGGVARYVELMMESGAVCREKMIETAFSEISSFMDEGKTVLSDEFGKDYGNYFSVIEAIASGKTSFAEISNSLGMDVGGYLTRLEAQYSLISKKQPIFERTRNKNCLYAVDDCFFRFWFRFVVGYQDLVELKRLDELKSIVRRDFDTFSGLALERYFQWKFIEERRYTKMGGWWDRKGENEIDLVCEDSASGGLDFYEVKRDIKRYDPNALKRKIEAFLAKNPTKKNSRISFSCLSLSDM